MEKKWVNILKSNHQTKINITQGLLFENGIQSVIVNKQDSSYLMFGEIHLYIHQENVMNAKAIINNNDREY
jgi:hypothetical protein